MLKITYFPSYPANLQRSGIYTEEAPNDLCRRRTVGKYENLVGQSIIQGLLIEQVLLLIWPKFGQDFHKSEKSARWHHCHKIIKTNLKTLVSPLLTQPQGSQGCQKMPQDLVNMPVEVWCAKIAPKLKNI